MLRAQFPYLFVMHHLLLFRASFDSSNKENQTPGYGDYDNIPGGDSDDEKEILYSDSPGEFQIFLSLCL